MCTSVTLMWHFNILNTVLQSYDISLWILVLPKQSHSILLQSSVNWHTFYNYLPSHINNQVYSCNPILWKTSVSRQTGVTILLRGNSQNSDFKSRVYHSGGCFTFPYSCTLGQKDVYRTHQRLADNSREDKAGSPSEFLSKKHCSERSRTQHSNIL